MEIKTLDLNFQNQRQAIAAYLIVGSAGPVLVETGPGSTLETLKARLGEHGYVPDDVRHVLVTHIHLDHAGAAGWWARHGARVYVHHVGAPHLIDPTRLLSSARRIYGDDMEGLWGEMLPAPEEHVQALYDGDTVTVGDLRLTALDTPGHAYHHHVFRLGDVAFTGDAAAVRMPDSAFISVPAPPPEFDLPAWRETIRRLSHEGFATIYPTHFGPHDDVQGHLGQLSALLEQSAEFVRDHMQQGFGRDALLEAYQAWVKERARAEGVADETFQTYEKANPTFMSVDGITRYWRKREEAQDRSPR
jgi:glyoxylase-like metal-dependent hydrolase (beta-lactamase superfamily II)